MDKICEVENLIGVAEESVESVKRSVYKQMQGIMEVAELGSRLNDASKGLMELQDNTGLEDLISESSRYSGRMKRSTAGNHSIIIIDIFTEIILLWTGERPSLPEKSI
ncbi:MAG: hypothetical protein ACOX4T_11675 [Acetivibrionales bacterium]